MPETTVRVDESLSPRRSTAYAFDVRRRPFCLLVATADSADRPVPLIVMHVNSDERAALLAGGHPYFPPRGRPDRIGVLLTHDTDWVELRELVTDSYRLLAPKKLIALLE